MQLPRLRFATLGKTRCTEANYPTQANIGLEWGTWPPYIICSTCSGVPGLRSKRASTVLRMT